MEILKEMMVFMGYAKEPQGEPENYTGFFDFNDDADQSWRDNYYGFRKQNEEMIKWVSTLNEKDLAEIQYELSDKKREVDLVNFETTEKVCAAICDYSSKLLYGKSLLKPCK